MSTSAAEIIALAQNTKALTKEQLARILAAAPKMTGEELEKLKSMLTTIKMADLNDMKKKNEVYQKAAAVHLEWQSDKTRHALQVQEGAVQREDTAQAETLIQNL
jgi:hypothetical protein